MFVHVYENQLISMSEHLEVYAFKSINASEWNRIQKRKDTRPCMHTPMHAHTQSAVCLW